MQKATLEEQGALLGLAVVELGDELFGVELAAVQEFCEIVQLTPIPCCPPHILGAISLRGDLVTLIDPRAALPGRVAEVEQPIAWVTQRLDACQQRLDGESPETIALTRLSSTSHRSGRMLIRCGS